MSASVILVNPAGPCRAAPRIVPLTAVAAVVAGLAGAADLRSATGVVAGVSVPVVVAAAVDWRTHRIPNRLTLVMVALAAVGVPIIVAADGRSVGDVALGGLSGFVCSGAPLVAALWVVRPGSIGGGDVKMLAVIGVALGFTAPLAAMLLLPMALLVAGVEAIVVRSRRVVLGPGLALGYLVAVTASVAWSDLLGGPYR